jgi:nucleoid-associated protein YejK
MQKPHHLIDEELKFTDSYWRTSLISDDRQSQISQLLNNCSELFRMSEHINITELKNEISNYQNEQFLDDVSIFTEFLD